MTASVRSYLSSGLAAATAGAIVVAPVEVQAPAEAAALPVALATQVQPLHLPEQIPALIAEQVAFNTGVAVDFVVTGAELIGRQVQVAQTLVDDVRNGTPIPVAVGRAVAGFTNIEVDAGHELVGFGRELVDFQIQFLGNLVSQLPPAVATPVGQALAVTAAAVDTVSDVTNDAIDRLAQVVNIPVAQSQSSGESRTEASRRLDNVVTLSRPKPKTTTAVAHDSTAATSNVRDTVRRVTHRLLSPAPRTARAAAASAADRTTAPHADSRRLAAREVSKVARPYAHRQRA